MLLKSDDVICALLQAKCLREAMDTFCLHPPTSPISMDVVVEGVQHLCEVTVEFRLLPFVSQNRLRGIYLPYESREAEGKEVVILLDADLPKPWQRYVAMKELGHIVLADADNVTYDPSLTIEFMVQDGVGGVVETAPPDAANEALAKIVAYETLFPHIERERARNMLSEDIFNLYRLSEEYELPQHVVESVLGNNYFNMCESLKGKI